MEDKEPIQSRLERIINVRWNGVESSGPLTIGRWIPERGKWACFGSIHAIHEREWRLCGDDPIQALDRTMHFIADLIRGSIEDGIDMWWQNEGDECGMG